MESALKDMYRTGVLWQDFQHRQLIDLFEDIKEARRQKNDKNLYRYTIAFLAMYVTHHFKLEEAYMEKYGYPGTEKHIQEHKDFIGELKEFRKEKSSYSDESAEELLTRLGEWILTHILDDDQSLGKFILENEKKAKEGHGKK